jgi:hypothetical protein
MYRTIVDLTKRTGLVARLWSFAFTLQSALGTTSPPQPGDSLDVSSLNLGGVTVSSGSGNLSYDIVGGSEGLGVSGGGSSAISGSESMSVTFATPAEKLGVTLNDFGGIQFFGFIPEVATLQFYRNGTLRNSTTISGCQKSLATGGPLASFTVTPGVTFDQVKITPFFSSFFLSAVKSCSSTDPKCLTVLDDGNPPASGGNHCPWP